MEKEILTYLEENQLSKRFKPILDNVSQMHQDWVDFCIEQFGMTLSQAKNEANIAVLAWIKVQVEYYLEINCY